jgi:hypothetical protein
MLGPARSVSASINKALSPGAADQDGHACNPPGNKRVSPPHKSRLFITPPDTPSGTEGVSSAMKSKPIPATELGRVLPAVVPLHERISNAPEQGGDYDQSDDAHDDEGDGPERQCGVGFLDDG